MGKGYNNYMTKKPFHPGSKANIKRTWMAEQRTENEKRKQEELKTQYDKEQDLYNNRALLSTESKDKLQLNFMYEAPPGAKRERQKEDDEPEYKFEWQRKYNAPREDYAKGNSEIRDQPFGIPVRNVRCIKCHKWGHINTDKECPLFTHASTSSMPTTSMDPLELMRQMREDGYDLKRSALGHQVNPKQANEQFIPSDHSDPEMEFLKTLSSKQKKKLLKKLNKLSKKQQKKEDQKKKKGKKKSKKRASDSDPESERESKKRRKKIKSEPSSSESDSSEEDEKPILKDKKAKETSNKGSKKLLSPQSSKHEKNHKQKSKHKTASKDNLEYEEKSHKVILSKSTTADKVKRTANDTKTEKSKEEKPSSEATASDTQKKDQSDKQDTNLSKEVLPQPSSSISQTTRVKIKVSGGSSSDTSDIRDKKISDVSDIRDKKSSDVSDTRDRSSKRLKVESPSSESRIFLKPDQSLPTTSRITEATVSDLPSSSRDDNLNQVGLHPDGFDPDHPQRTPGATSSHNPRKQDQNLHQRFREHHRHRRSPSVKHKYRND